MMAPMQQYIDAVVHAKRDLIKWIEINSFENPDIHAENVSFFNALMRNSNFLRH